MGNIAGPGPSWGEAIATNGMSACGAKILAGSRLLFWHLAQPVLYIVIFSVYSPQLGAGATWNTRHGFVLGLGVAIREGLYFVITLACLYVNPAFLLVDVGASVRDSKAKRGLKGPMFLVMYVLAPEKFVAIALFGWGATGWKQRLGTVCMFVSPVLDLCGLGALGAGLASHELPPALAVAYVVTSIGAISMVGFVAVEGSKHPIQICGNRSRWLTGALIIGGALVFPLCPTFFIPFSLGKHEGNFLSGWQWALVMLLVGSVTVAVASLLSKRKADPPGFRITASDRFPQVGLMPGDELATPLMGSGIGSGSPSLARSISQQMGGAE
jgi:hypothetical protein